MREYKEKRIAFFIGDITRRAGTERAVTNLANAMAEEPDKKIFIISMYSKNGVKPSYSLNPNIKVLHLNLFAKNKIGWVKVYSQYINKCNAIIREFSLTHLIGTTHAINSLLTLMKGDVKKIGCEHMSYAACPKYSQLIRKITYKKLDAVVLLTRKDAEHYSFVNSEKIFVIPNISSFSSCQTAKLINHRAISVGRLTKQKGFDLLIQAISNIKENIGDWKFFIYGDGEDKELLQNLIKSNGLDQIVFIKSPVNNIEEKYLESSFYVMSSRWEGLPMVLIEAQSCGLPIISFDCPEGPRDIVNDNFDGILVNNGDIKMLGESVLTLIEDENLRISMGKKALINSNNYSSPKILEKWNKVLNSQGK